MVRLLSRDDRSEGGKREVNTREGHQVGLELVQVDVERTIEAERRGDRRDNLCNETIEVRERRRADVQAVLANVVNGLVVDLPLPSASQNMR